VENRSLNHVTASLAVQHFPPAPRPLSFTPHTSHLTPHTSHFLHSPLVDWTGRIVVVASFFIVAVVVWPNNVRVIVTSYFIFVVSV